jgi:glycolate oxidase iron-sulfur subunit
MFEEISKLLLEEINKCVSCGLCEAVCPTLPHMNFKLTYGPRGRVILAKELMKTDQSSIGEIKIDLSDYFYSCLRCRACYNACAAEVDVGLVSLYSRILIRTGNFKNLTVKKIEKPLAKMFAKIISNNRTPLASIKIFSKWSEGLEFDEDSDTLLYTGGLYQLVPYMFSLKKLINSSLGKLLTKLVPRIMSLFPDLITITSFIKEKELEIRVEKILRNIYELLKTAGVRFRYIPDEPYNGVLLYELGYIEEFIKYGEFLKEFFDKNKISTIITIDPHTYEALKHLYPKYVKEFNYRVYHYLELIRNLDYIKRNVKYTLHEPCIFAMHLKYYLPIHILSSIGDLVLPQRSKEKSFCCGGPAELLYPELTDRISEHRFRQLKDTGAEKIVTACPICLLNLVKDATVFDLAEILIEHIKK